MMRCINLAKNGLGSSYPNPLVGSVIVHKDEIIGEGWHYKAGMPHAEVNAINSVKNKNLLKEATIYVSLEPCSFHGKTPACSELIIKSSIKKVVVGSVDPNPKVAGRGIQKLKDAGCNVEVGILKNQCALLNKGFFTFHKKKRPFIILKWAQTADGYIAPDESTRQEKAPVWITNKYSRQAVHKMRAEEQAILVGTNTVLQDNPSLTTRDWHGSNPVRIVLDKSLRLPPELHVFDYTTRTIVLTEIHQEDSDNLEYVQLDFSQNFVKNICDVLFTKGIQSVIVEGGRQTLQSFINENLWDEAFVFSGTNTFHSGTKAPEISGEVISRTDIKGDNLKIIRNPNTKL